MANLPETSQFDTGVYQIETTDPVLGGPNGVANAPLKNLANRTKYLKDLCSSIAATVAEITPGSSVGNVTPVMDGTAAVGTATTAARSDHVHPTDTSRAPLASPAFTGTPTATTAPGGTNNTQLATTAFANSLRGSYKETPIVTGGPFALSTAHAGMCITCGGSGGYSVTLPDYSTFTVGGYAASTGLVFRLAITAPNITITLQNTTNTFIFYSNGTQAYGTSIVVTTGDYIEIGPVNGAWQVLNGIPASQLKGAPLPNNTSGAIGYLNKIYVNAATTATYTLPSGGQYAVMIVTGNSNGTIGNSIGGVYAGGSVLSVSGQYILSGVYWRIA